jgi:hypothetical protein
MVRVRMKPQTFPLSLTLSRQGREDNVESFPFSTGVLLSCSLSLDERKGGQASSEDLLPLGYGERERLGEGENLEIASRSLP